jgi:hypothetical protein
MCRLSLCIPHSPLPTFYYTAMAHGEGDDEYPDQMTRSFCLIFYQQVRKVCDLAFWKVRGCFVVMVPPY